MKKVITRFAPSPSGYLHIGGLRTALFAWAFAKRHDGEFLLRIEDTDRERSTSEFSDAIIKSLKWCGITPNHQPTFQSNNSKRHKECVERLLDEGNAYYCHYTPDEIEDLKRNTLRERKWWRRERYKPHIGRKPSVRYKYPIDGETALTDAIKGEIRVENDTIEDFVLLRSNGTPTYNLACVVDDIDMEISHVIRGDDHIMNTIKQLHLFKSLGVELPVFAHLSMILSSYTNEKGENVTERMSKRNSAVDVGMYREKGYLPEAILNYLARLSWSHNNDEIFDVDFFVNNFDLEKVSQSPATFDYEKMKWVNKTHLKEKSLIHLRHCLKKDVYKILLKTDGLYDFLRDRCETIRDIEFEAEYFITAPKIDEVMVGKYLTNDIVEKTLILIQKLRGLKNWKTETIKIFIKETAKENGLKYKDFGMILRTAITGREKSPDIATVMEFLGKREVINRLDPFIYFRFPASPF